MVESQSLEPFLSGSLWILSIPMQWKVTLVPFGSFGPQMTECPWAHMHAHVLLPSASFSPQANFRLVKGWHKLFQ